jgi:hypothetical protein
MVWSADKEREPVPVTGNAERSLPDAPRTLPGAPKGNRNAFKHGRYAAEAIARRREIAELVSAMKPLNTGRTFAFAFHNPTSKGVARSSRFSAARWRGRYGARAAAGDAGGRISQPPGARMGISWMHSAGVLPKPGTSFNGL